MPEPQMKEFVIVFNDATERRVKAERLVTIGDGTLVLCDSNVNADARRISALVRLSEVRAVLDAEACCEPEAEAHAKKSHEAKADAHKK